MSDATFIQESHSGVEIDPGGDGEADVVKPHPVLVKGVFGDWAQSEQRVSETVDDSTEQEPKQLPGGVVGIGRNFKGDRPTEEVIVEGPRPRPAQVCRTTREWSRDTEVRFVQ